MIGTLN